ncbi:MAG: ankyrin repeat domain-containing protein [Alphaproteobacteria bacterium]|nr:ankyrin repeat domain-containing protein [Alphaproteobacteria bacterium]OJV15356.1 MAG: hypothetical protein BGO27_02485 [Alphaproteobacteria bacterium 33-17]
MKLENEHQNKDYQISTEKLFSRLNDQDSWHEDFPELEITVKNLMPEQLTIVSNDDENNNLLHFASAIGNLETVIYLINNGIKADIKNRWKSTPAYYAVEYGKLEVVKYLINETNVNINIKHFNGDTLLHQASMRGYFEIIKYLIEEKNMNVDILNNSRETPLKYASRNGHLKTVKYLVKKGANTNICNIIRHTPLHIAAYSGHLDIVKYLVKKGANVLSRDIANYTALLYAGEKRNLEMIKYFAQNGGNVDDSNISGSTSLHYAALYGCTEIVNFLVNEKNASVNAVDSNQKTPLHYATEQGYKNIADLLWSKISDNTKNKIIQDNEITINQYKQRRLIFRNYATLNIMYEQNNLEKDRFIEFYHHIYQNHNINISGLIGSSDASFNEDTKKINSFIKTLKLNIHNPSSAVYTKEFKEITKDLKSFAIAFAGKVIGYRYIETLPFEIQSHIFSYLNIDLNETLLLSNKIKKTKLSYRIEQLKLLDNKVIETSINNKKIPKINTTHSSAPVTTLYRKEHVIKHMDSKFTSSFNITNIVKVSLNLARRLGIGMLVNKGLKALAPRFSFLGNKAVRYVVSTSASVFIGYFGFEKRNYSPNGKFSKFVFEYVLGRRNKLKDQNAINRYFKSNINVHDDTKIIAKNHPNKINWKDIAFATRNVREYRGL